MNIFVVHQAPRVAAEMLNDRHVMKMIVESSQMLANAFPLKILEEAPRTKAGHTRIHSYLHHPCSKWVLQDRNNWMWLLRHSIQLCHEFEYRRDKTHFTKKFVWWCANHRNCLELPNIKRTPFVLAMPDIYKVECPIESYRNYYRAEKNWTWTKREKPFWLEKN